MSTAAGVYNNVSSADLCRYSRGERWRWMYDTRPGRLETGLDCGGVSSPHLDPCAPCGCLSASLVARPFFLSLAAENIAPFNGFILLQIYLRGNRQPPCQDAGSRKHSTRKLHSTLGRYMSYSYTSLSSLQTLPHPSQNPSAPCYSSRLAIYPVWRRQYLVRPLSKLCPGVTRGR